jgi:hypothetical protein
MPTLDYYAAKTAFEKNVVCIVLNGEEWYVCKSTGCVADTTVIASDPLITQFTALSYNVKQPCGVRTKHPFLLKWLTDPQRVVVSSIICEPVPPQASVLTLWQPFQAETITPVLDGQKLIEPLLNYVHTSLGEQGANLVFDFFAHTLAQPAHRLHFALAIVGDDWYMCSFLVHFFARRVVGPYLSKRLMDTDPASRKGCRFLWIDYHEIPEAYSAIPNEQTTKLSALGPPCWSIPNTANMVATTRVPPTNHVFRSVRCEHVAPSPSVEAMLFNPDVARAFYDFLLARPLNRFSSKDS